MSQKKSLKPDLLATTDGTKRTRIQTENRAKLLEAATAVFARSGFAGATLDEIAGLAQMSKPNLLYYFKNKNALYLAVLQQILVRWLAPLEHLQVEMDPVDELSAYIEAKFAFSRAEPLPSKVWANEIISGGKTIRPVLETQLREIVERKAAVLDAWQASGRIGKVYPQHLIYLIWAVTQTYADFASQIEAVSGRGLDDERFYREALENAKQVILYGVMPRS